MLVPDIPSAPTQVIDARDLAAWMVESAERGVTGAYNAGGPMIAFSDWLELSRSVGGHVGPTVVAESQWLLDHGVEQFMGDESLPMWLIEPGWEGFSHRSWAAAEAAGLVNRPREELLADHLAWAREEGLDVKRRSGLSAERERELLAELSA